MASFNPHPQPRFDASARYARRPLRSSAAAPTVSKSRRIGRFLRSRRGIMLLAIVFMMLSIHGVWAKHVAAETLQHKAQVAQSLADQGARVAKLRGQIAALQAANPQIDLSVSVSGSSASQENYGESTAFDGASTGKLLTAVDYLHHVERGSASLRQTIDGQSAEALLQAMIVNSDDTAWAELNDYLGHADLSQYATSIGFAQYDATTNNFPASSVATLLQKMYDRQLLNDADRSLLLSYMGKANYRQFIVPAVPVGSKVYHKIGIDNDTVNDAAVIATGNQRVVLVIFTNGNGLYEWDQRATLMQTITHDVEQAYPVDHG